MVKINPALITVTDGLVDKRPVDRLQQMTVTYARELLEHKVRTFHVDINFDDYGGFSDQRPDINVSIFTPPFITKLNEIAHSFDGFLNLHLLTNTPYDRLRQFEHIGLGAICFQLDAVSSQADLKELVRRILDSGACASPVIETVGSENLAPRSREEVLSLLEPVLSDIGMLTFQASGTASRSHSPAGSFNRERAIYYIDFLKEFFKGAIQIQGGVTSRTIGEAVRMGAEFIVCGSEVFRNRDGLTAPQAIDRLLREAAKALEFQEAEEVT